MKHETGEGEKVQPCQRRSEPLVVASQAPESRGPGEIALDDPALRPTG